MSMSVKSSKSGGAITQMRTTVINRSSVGSRSSGSFGSFGGGGFSSMRQSSMRMSYGGPLYSQGTISGISHVGVTEIVDTRAKEKQEMQILNERFAGYIEKVRFLEAQNKACLIEIERLKNMKGFDAKEMKTMYETEITQMREIIKQLTEEKAEFDTKICGLEDRLEAEKIERKEAEKLAQQWRNEMDSLNSQIGECEGELATFRARFCTVEEEKKSLKEKIDRLEGQLCVIRNDLDEETQKRIIAENQYQMYCEQFELSKGIFDAEIEQYKMLIDKDKTVELRDVWKNELKKCIVEIQKEYDDKLGFIKADYETKIDMQMKQLHAGVTRDNTETLQAREESKKLKVRLAEFGPRMAELEAEAQRLRLCLSEKEEAYDDMERSMQIEIDRLNASYSQVSANLEVVIQELKSLQDVKMSLELEISCYRKLLEGEESKLSAIVQEASGARSRGGEALATMFQQQSSSSSVRGGGQSYSSSSVSGGQSYSMKESQGQMTIQKTSRGPISISECPIDGSYIELQNTKLEPQRLYEWKITRTGHGKGGKVVTYEFPNITLDPGKSIRIFGEAGREMHEDKFVDQDQCGNFTMWGSGSCDFKLTDRDGNEKAKLVCKFNM